MQSSFEWFTLIETVGIISFAVNAMMIAKAGGLSTLGIFICSFVAAFGGGTVRDLLLGPQAQPFFWVANPFYIVAIFTVAIIYANVPQIQKLIERRDVLLKEGSEALAHASLCAGGAAKTYGLLAPGSGDGLLSLSHLWILCAVMGMIASGFGTIIRDVVINEFPKALYPGMWVLEGAFVGSAAVTTMLMLGVERPWAVLVGFLAALGIRSFAILQLTEAKRGGRVVVRGNSN